MCGSLPIRIFCASFYVSSHRFLDCRRQPFSLVQPTGLDGAISSHFFTFFHTISATNEPEENMHPATQMCIKGKKFSAVNGLNDTVAGVVFGHPKES